MSHAFRDEFSGSVWSECAAYDIVRVMTLPRFIYSVLFYGTLTLTGLTGCADEDWERSELNGQSEYFSGVWGSSEYDVFVVGGTTRGVVWHWDGNVWEEMEVPFRTPALIWVFGFSPQDVYAVGDNGAFVHYDGVTWSALHSNTSKTLWGVWGNAPDSIWMVGGEIDNGRPTIRRWNGSESEVFEIDASEHHEDVHALFKVWGVGEDVFAVGQKGTVVRHQQGQWSAVPTGPEATQDFIGIWGTSMSDIIAVGGRSQGQIAVFNGREFETQLVEAVSGVDAVFACNDTVLVGGSPQFIGSFDRDTRAVSVDTITLNPVHAIWSDCSGASHAVGGFFSSPQSGGVALVR